MSCFDCFHSKMLTASASKKRTKQQSDDKTAVLEEDDKNGITYRTMSVSDVNKVIRVMALAFYTGEPVAGALGASFRDHEQFVAMFVPRMAVEGNSIIAVGSKTGKVLGGFLNEDYCNPDPEKMDAFLREADGDWMPVVSMIGGLEEGFNAAYGLSADAQERPKGKFFHLWMLGVLPEARGKSIGVKLTENSLRWAKQRGFEVAFAECSGAYSTAILKKLGAHTQAFLGYDTYESEVNNEGNDYSKLNQLPEKGHQGLSMMVTNV